MIIKQINQFKEEFEPVTLKLTIDDIRELRLLFHCFNNNKIGKLIKKYGYKFGSYTGDVADEFTGLCYEPIKNIIEKQGFEI